MEDKKQNKDKTKTSLIPTGNNAVMESQRLIEEADVCGDPIELKADKFQINTDEYQTNIFRNTENQSQVNLLQVEDSIGQSIDHDYGTHRELERTGLISSVLKLGQVAPLPKSKFASRRDLHYSDSDSGDSDGEDLTDDWVKDSEQYLNCENFEQKVRANARFKNYRDVFNNLVVSKSVMSMYPIVSAAIAFDSKAVITITKASEKEYWLKMYSLATNLQIFGEKYGGNDLDDAYIKMKEVAQNAVGDKYAQCYFNNGKFLLRTFGRTERTEEEITKNEVCFNDLLKINDHTMPVSNFPDPFITACFINDDLLFVQLFYTPTLTHYHLFWDIKAHAIKGEPYTLAMSGGSKTNFPYKCFYNDDDEEIYAFYRQGQFLNIPVPGGNKQFAIETDNCTDMSLGDMYLVFNKLLVARSSQEIVFFRLELDENNQRGWKQFHSLQHKGFLFFIKGNIRIQITTDEKIYFYLINPQTLMPELENVMYNYMNCNQTMFGKRVRFCVTYKTNMKGFEVYRRRFQHNFKVPVNVDNLEGASALELANMGQMLVTMRDKVSILDTKTFKKVDELPISLFKSETREITQVLAIQKCQNEEYLAVISGKKFIKDQSKANQLFIFKRQEDDKFKQINRVVIKDIAIFEKVSLRYHFLNVEGTKDRTKVLFCKADCIFTINFHNEQVDVIYTFKTPLNNQPSFFETNTAQGVFSISTKKESRLIDTTDKTEISISDDYKLENFSTVMFDVEDDRIYYVANKLDGEVGFYILSIDANQPYNGLGKNDFVLKWKRQLDIGDCDISILRDEKNNYKEIVIAYKTIYINVYTIMVIDQNHKSGQPLLYRHESFQLWESQINGILLKATNDFVAVNRDGINVFALGSTQKREIIDFEGNPRMMNSLESMNYLKLDPTNVLVFANQNMAKREVVVQQVSKDTKKDVAIFTDLFAVKIHAITLRELLLIQSIYVCKTQSDIVSLVADQPKPTLFYKTFLELNGTNMTSIMAFDSRSLSILLADKFQDLFSSDYPIFYKNKVDKGKIEKQKFCFKNALDTAVNFDQSRACERIISYLTKYQNNYISHYLFLKNLHILIQKGINITSLLESDILTYTFDFDEWPSMHTDDNKYIRPYNGSIFDIQNAYDSIFYEKHFEDVIRIMAEGTTGHGTQIDASRVYKIKYTLSLLPCFGEHSQMYHDAYGKEKFELMKQDIPFMEIMSESEEYDIFNTEAIKDFIDFKWAKIGRNHHTTGGIVHLIYILYLAFYVNHVYIDAAIQKDPNDKAPKGNPASYIFAVSIIYPAGYEFIQLYQYGPLRYFSDSGNIQTIIFIITGILNTVLHLTRDPYKFEQKFILVLNLILSLNRSMKLMRIMEIFSPIVNMMTGVFSQFKDFMLFFFILLALFSMGLSIMQIDNVKNSRAFVTAKNASPYGYNGSEYQYLSGTATNFLNMLRISMADTAVPIGAINYLESPYNEFMWLYLVLSLLVCSIIFINFVITKACSEYDNISERLSEYILRDRTNLISEADIMTTQRGKNKNAYPKYFIVRQIQV